MERFQLIEPDWHNNPRSGYVLRKFNPEEGDLTGAIQHTDPWIIFRLAEIYMNYAEAEFELGNEAVAREYINKVRARANMPGLPDSVTGETLRTRLYNERRVEFAFEESPCRTQVHGADVSSPNRNQRNPQEQRYFASDCNLEIM